MPRRRHAATLPLLLMSRRYGAARLLLALMPFAAFFDAADMMLHAALICFTPARMPPC